ncbi:MAG: single-stranded DNA-binding protein [Gammaproteobacteria bacterium]
MAGKGSLNKAIVIGNLGNDPELRNLPDGSSVVNFSLATSDVYTDKTGQKVERTEWHRISFFGRPAEIIHEYARKGAKLYVEGFLQTRKWQDKEGHDRYTTEIKGREFLFLGPRPQDSGGESRQDYRSGGGGGGGSSGGGGGDNFGDMDDIPF